MRWRIAALARQAGRALRHPSRLRVLHPSGVLAALHELIEPGAAELLANAFGISPATFAGFEADLLGDQAFRACLAQRHARVRGSALRAFERREQDDDCVRFRLLYYLVRAQRPRVCVETGVFDGVSSAVILKALRDNGEGTLHSIDLPARRPQPASTARMRFSTLPPGCEPGWLIPDALRERWRLRVGPSEELLPPWLGELGAIDFFLHDSLHTRAHMLWEYTTVWPALAAGGLLVSDDVFWSRAFFHFSREVGAAPRIARGLGWLRKPTPSLDLQGSRAAVIG
jgi:predicted O-methyltransferase YrrM